MKKVKYVDFKTTVMGTEVEIFSRDEMIRLVKLPKDPTRGTTFDEMRLANKLMDALEGGSDDGFVMLEDAPFKDMVERLKNAGWVENNKDIERMIQNIADSPDG